MAIDNEAKRWSMLRVSTPGIVFNPSDSGADSAIERATVLRIYGGNLTNPFATVSGTADTATEADIVAGGKTVVITLANDTWVDAGSTFNAQRQAIIDGLTSAQSESTGWNAEVRDKLAVTTVARTSNTVVTVTLAAAPDYDITANETITVTVPASALVNSGSALVGGETLTISFISDVATETTASGGYGFWFAWEKELERRKRERKQHAKREKKARKLEEKLDRELAIAERKIEQEASRKAELARLNRLVANNKVAILSFNDARLEKAMSAALEQQTFSTIERLERQISRVREEEEFLMNATLMILNA